jgi:hypothetical protein
VKKIIYFLLFLVLNLISFSYVESFDMTKKYVVFFAEVSNIPDDVAYKILFSKCFCMTVPLKSADEIPKNLDELISCGKIEPSLSFSPEPVLSILVMLSNFSSSKNKKKDIFNEYILSNLNSYKRNVNKTDSGIFLNFASLSRDVICCLVNLGVPWINIDNFEETTCGIYNIYGIAAFSLYKNFPYNQVDIVKWLESKKHQFIIPIMLKKKHLQNIKFMEYLINIFDNNVHIKPATPLYVSKLFKEELPILKKKTFKQFEVEPLIRKKLCKVADLINNYSHSINSDLRKYAYINAKTELIYLCSYDLLKDINSGKESAKRMFDIAYKNIYRLLSLVESETKNDSDILVSDIKNFDLPNIVEIIPDGILISNNGILNFVRIVSKEENIRVSFSFVNGKWDDNISFIDFYIDLNHIEGAGSTLLLPGIDGYLTSDSGWEYALRIYKNKAVLYKYSLEKASVVSNLIVHKDSVSIPYKYVRGTPANWGFQAIVVSDENGQKKIIDFLNQSKKSKEYTLSMKPFQISAVRKH